MVAAVWIVFDLSPEQVKTRVASEVRPRRRCSGLTYPGPVAERTRVRQAYGIGGSFTVPLLTWWKSMAKATPILWKHKPNADGHFPIWIRLADRYRTLYHSLGEYVAARHWNPNARRVRKSHPVADDLNSLIQDKLAVAQAERVRLKRAGKPVTAEAIKEALVGADPDKASGDFLAYADRHVAALGARGQIREQRRQKAVFKKLRAWSKGALPFDRITPRLLKDYETHLLGLGNQPSTVNSNFRVIRTALYAAMREGEFPQERNPFLRFKLIKKNAPNRPKLTAEQVMAVERVDLGGSGPGAPLVAQVRDCFLFSFYGAGVRFTDVALMRRSNVRVVEGEGEARVTLSYVMGKTGKPTTVRMAPAATPLVQAYLEREAPGDDPFLFPLLDGHDVSTPEALVKASGSQNAVVNKYLKKVASAVEAEFEIQMPNLTFHGARHAWADLARKSGRDLHEIRDAMKHSGLSVTEHYFASGEGAVVDAEI